jgi:hypothetical protein
MLGMGIREWERGEGRGMRTFGSVGGFVISSAEPFEVLVFDPGHPSLVLVIIVFFQPLGVCLLFFLLFGEFIVFLLRLLFGGLRLAAGVLGGHYSSIFGKQKM